MHFHHHRSHACCARFSPDAEASTASTASYGSLLSQQIAFTGKRAQGQNAQGWLCCIAGTTGTSRCLSASDDSGWSAVTERGSGFQLLDDAAAWARVRRARSQAWRLCAVDAAAAAAAAAAATAATAPPIVDAVGKPAGARAAAAAARDAAAARTPRHPAVAAGNGPAHARHAAHRRRQ